MDEWQEMYFFVLLILIIILDLKRAKNVCSFGWSKIDGLDTLCAAAMISICEWCV